jgi:hypothetical protein
MSVHVDVADSNKVLGSMHADVAVVSTAGAAVVGNATAPVAGVGSTNADVAPP